MTLTVAGCAHSAEAPTTVSSSADQTTTGTNDLPSLPEGSFTVAGPPPIATVGSQVLDRVGYSWVDEDDNQVVTDDPPAVSWTKLAQDNPVTVITVDKRAVPTSVLYTGYPAIDPTNRYPVTGPGEPLECTFTSDQEIDVEPGRCYYWPANDTIAIAFLTAQDNYFSINASWVSYSLPSGQLSIYPHANASWTATFT